MKRLRIGVSTLTDARLLAKAFHVETMLAANTGTFPDPRPTVAEISAARLHAEQATADALDGGRILTFQKNQALERLRRLLTNVSYYVKGVAQGNPMIIVLSGFEVRSGNAPLGMLENPTGLKVTRTGRRGEMKLRWKPRHGARTYIVYMTTDNPSDPDTLWTRIGQSTKATFFPADLQPGQCYAFAVAALGALGVTGKSDPAILMAA